MDPREIDAPTGGLEAVMRRLPWRLIAAAIGLLALTLSAHAQQRPRPPERTGSVTILTDGIAEPNSRATRAINELAKDLGSARGNVRDNVRVLPIAGHGAVANVRDLLQLRGVDLAVLNSDIFLFLDQTRQYPKARSQIHYVTHIYNQKVYLLARKEFNTLDDLRGRRLGVLSGEAASHTTAMTLFGLLGIDVALQALGSDAYLDDPALEKLDGVLLLSDELARVRLSAQARQDLRVLPISLTPALRNGYRPAVIEPQELPGLPIAGNTDTVAVSTLLAVYNWLPSQRRFADVSAFASGLFSTLPKLRETAGSLWRQADLNAQIEGWPRYSVAQRGRALDKAQLAPPAPLDDEPTATLPPAVETAPATATAKIKVLAIARAPLADEQQPEGGLIPELLRSSLGKAKLRKGSIGKETLGKGSSGGAGSEIELRWTTAAPVKSLLSDASIDISLPWDGADCERPNDLVQASAVLCDKALYSDPILEVVVGLFTRSDSNFSFDTDESIFGRTICMSADQDASPLNSQGRAWLSQKRLTVIRQPTLLDCASAVQTQEVDAFVASDLEGRYVLDRLGLSGQFKMAERPLGIRGVHAVASREHAQASELIAALNRGLQELKASGAYAAIVRSHLSRLWNAQAGTP
jgi:ABC-type amino acid transport substrate-binding protein